MRNNRNLYFSIMLVFQVKACRVTNFLTLKVSAASAAMVDVDAGQRGLERGKSFVLVSQPLRNWLVHLNIVLKWGKCECLL